MRFICVVVIYLVNITYVNANSLTIAQESLMQFTLFQLVCNEKGVSDGIMQLVLQDVAKELKETEELTRTYIAEAAVELSKQFIETKTEKLYCDTMRQSFIDLGLKP